MSDVRFEVGQVLRASIYGDGGDAPLLVREVSAGGIVTSDLRCGGVEVRLHPDEMTQKPRIASPAPKSRQRWRNGNGWDVGVADADGGLVAEDWIDGGVLYRGSVVDVARWLTDRNYRCIIDPCDRTSAEIGPGDSDHGLTKWSSQIVTADEVNRWSAEQAECTAISCGAADFTKDRSGNGNDLVVSGRPRRTPAEVDSAVRSVIDWGVACESSAEDAAPEAVRPSGDATAAAPSKFAPVPLATSRRLVDEAVRGLRGEPFAKAIQATLISLCGDRLEFGPRQVDIQAAIYACQAWEHARGKVAPGKRSLSKAEHRELAETAKIAAWGAGIAMQDASDIGEIVSETYERVRATC